MDIFKRIQLLALLCAPVLAAAQVCTGNLGDNLFLDGDFGSGTANILLPNPNIAPDYGYGVNPPPPDGSYVITNNTGVWPNLYGSWMRLGDNSPDPNGYMMVVNASFTPGLFYNQVVDGLCENTRYVFSADIINIVRIGVTNHIQPNVSFLIDGMEQFSTGNIPATETWQTYGFTFSTGPGQTEVRLSLRNNAPGGNGNDLALDNISFRACGDEAFILPNTPANICEDGQPITLDATVQGSLFNTPAVQWQISPDGINDWTDIPGATDFIYVHAQLVPGTYYYRFLLANAPGNLANAKCRVNSNVKRVIVQPKLYELRDTICTGSTYSVGNSTYTTSGIFADTLVSSFGCDSIVRLSLTVLPDPQMVAILDMQSPDCFNDPTGSITVTGIQNGYPPYTVFLNGVLGNNTGLFPGLLPNVEHALLVTDRYGCRLDSNVYLTGPPLLTLDVGENITAPLGEQVRITPTINFTAVDYSWSSDSDEIPCTSIPDCGSITWTPTQTQRVYLTATDAQGCSVSDSLQVEVVPDYTLYIPNAFSPNADGVNDYFSVYGPAPRVSAIQRMQIFDRWGQLMYDAADLPANSPSTGWNGTAKGQAVSEGVYLYQLEVRFLNGRVLGFSGEVVVVR